MIDKARVENLYHEAQRTSGVDAELVLDIDTEALPILTDYLALREIVEALAACNPIASSDTGAWCVFCESFSWDFDGVVHDQCPWAAAVALVGSASGARTEANPLEFEGVGEENR